MSRLMSVSLTEDQVRARTKSQTRRMGWAYLKPGERLTLCRKVMGRRRRDGSIEPLVRIVDVDIVSVRREPLNQITAADVAAEGFPDWTPEGFIRFFCSTHKGCTPDTVVTVIDWAYGQEHSPSMEQVCAAVSAARYVYVSEVDLHGSLERALVASGLSPEREVRLTHGRIDFTVGRVGIEVKVKGTTRDVERQLRRYATDPRVESLVLVTSCRRHRDLAGTVGGKPVAVVVIGGVS